MKLPIFGAWLTLTRRCQAKCGWCYSQEGASCRGSMSIELASKLLDIIQQCTHAQQIILIGGEPTIYPDFFSIIEMIRERGLEPSIVTNGFRLSDKRFVAKLAKAQIKHLTISLKAANDVDYEKYVCVKRGFSRVRCAIQNCRDEGIPVTLSITISESFVERPHMFLEAIMRLQPQYADFGPANPILLSNGVNANGVPDPIVLAEMVTLIHSSLKDTTVNYGFEMNIPFCLIDQKVKSELLRDGKMRRACHIPTGSGLIFDESGAVLPCNFFSTHTLGKYPTDFSGPENFGAFWANKEVRAFRSLVASYPSTKCVSCREWDMCGGGCVIKWLYWDPKEYIKGYTD